MKKIFLLLAFTIAALPVANTMEQNLNTSAPQPTQLQTIDMTTATTTLANTDLEKYKNLYQILSQEIEKNRGTWQKRIDYVLSSKKLWIAICLLAAIGNIITHDKEKGKGKHQLSFTCIPCFLFQALLPCFSLFFLV